MKRILAAILAIVMIFSFAACGKSTNPENKIIPDIRIEEIEWSVGAGTVKGENYVLLEYTNGSQYAITSFELKFTEKSKISKENKDKFYLDLQKSQGYDDEYMQAFIESNESLKQPITMYGRCEEEVGVGIISPKIKCYYYGGLSSRDVIHSDLLTPKIATIKYTKDGVKHTLYYNFESRLYDLEID